MSLSLDPTMSSNPISTGGTTEHSIFRSNTLTVDNKNSTLRKQQVFQSETNKSPSPTALGLLLRSSLFRELTERALNATDEEDEENDTKFHVPTATGNDNGVGGIFDNEIGNLAYMCSSDADPLPGLVSPQESTLHFITSSGDWNRT